MVWFSVNVVSSQLSVKWKWKYLPHGLLWGTSKTKVECLAQCLAHSKPSINNSYCWRCSCYCCCHSILRNFSKHFSLTIVLDCGKLVTHCGSPTSFLIPQLHYHFTCGSWVFPPHRRSPFTNHPAWGQRVWFMGRQGVWEPSGERRWEWSRWGHLVDSDIQGHHW